MAVDDEWCTAFTVTVLDIIYRLIPFPFLSFNRLDTNNFDIQEYYTQEHW
jgi:hypothetical protein